MDIEEAKNVWKELRKRKGVQGFSGTSKPKEVDGQPTKDVGLAVYVDKKVPEEELRSKDLIPRKVNNIRTDVKAIGKMKALSFRPAKSGYSAIFYGGTACTFGGVATDINDGQIIVFANNHCSANENKLSPGAPYVCPSPIDNGTMADKLGELKRYVPIVFDSYACIFRGLFGLRAKARHLAQDLGIKEIVWNEVDIGIIKVNPADVVTDVDKIGVIMGARRGTLGEFAHKTGRTTGYTQDAILIDNDYYGQIGYSRGSAEFGPVGLLEGKGFSAGGDSSSLILWKADNTLGGELFAGSDTNTLFCHIEAMERVGQIKI